MLLLFIVNYVLIALLLAWALATLYHYARRLIKYLSSPKPPPAALPPDAGAKSFVGKELRIDYVDFDGDYTCRDITVWRIFRKNCRNYIRAYCHLRHAYRTFVLERIQGPVIDLATGELMPARVLMPAPSLPVVSRRKRT